MTTTMKLSDNTIAALKNFSHINQSLLFRRGSTLSTISQGKTIIGIADIDERFDKDFAVYDLSRLLATMSMFNTPELEIGESDIRISEGERSVRYMLTDPAHVLAPTERHLTHNPVDPPDITFQMQDAAFKSALRAAGVLGLPEITFLGENGKIYLAATGYGSKHNTEGDWYKAQIGESNRNFRAVFSGDSLKMLPRDYEVSIATKGIALFSSDDGGKRLRYYVPLVSKLSNFD